LLATPQSDAGSFMGSNTQQASPSLHVLGPQRTLGD
jgi:hypothetical protein